MASFNSWQGPKLRSVPQGLLGWPGVNQLPREIYSFKRNSGMHGKKKLNVRRASLKTLDHDVKNGGQFYWHGQLKRDPTHGRKEGMRRYQFVVCVGHLHNNGSSYALLPRAQKSERIFKKAHLFLNFSLEMQCLVVCLLIN